jgi:hypothetical protein
MVIGVLGVWSQWYWVLLKRCRVVLMLLVTTVVKRDTTSVIATSSIVRNLLFRVRSLLVRDRSLAVALLATRVQKTEFGQL